MGFAVPEKRRGLAANLVAYLESDQKARIDWADPQERQAELARLVADADAVLALAQERADDPEMRTTGWLLTNILGDDVKEGADGQPQIGEGVARDRLISWTDPTMRHGRKSASGRWNGAKVQLVEEPASELITAVELADASAGDGKALLALVDATEVATQAAVEQVIGDTAYGEAENRVACLARGIDLGAPVPSGGDPAVAKDAFPLSENGESLTCPGGQTTTDWREGKDSQGRTVKQFRFARQVCETCPLCERCVRSKTTGRTVTLHDHEGALRAARERQATPEFREQYRQRATIERKIAEVMGQGLRQARDVGRAKQRLQAVWTVAVVNLKRLLTLAQHDPLALREALVGRSPQAVAGMTR